MSLSLILLPLLMQAEPMVSGGAAPPLRHPPALERNRPARRAAPAAVAAPPAASRSGECLAEAISAPTAAIDLAEAWAAEAQGSAKAEPQLCLGAALSELGRWDEAEAAFIAGRDIASATDTQLRIRLGAMAGQAALAGGAPDRALAAFDSAHQIAQGSGDAKVAGEIAVDRARALVALKREADAAAALAEARTANPASAQGWLLSATLSRRMGKLAEAQAQIEQAVTLLPVDPEIGLEAGVIAVLSGRDEAARKSWQSVITAAPQSEAAQTAKGYLEQLGAPAAPATAASGR